MRKTTRTHPLPEVPVDGVAGEPLLRPDDYAASRRGRQRAVRDGPTGQIPLTAHSRHSSRPPRCRRANTAVCAIRRATYSAKLGAFSMTRCGRAAREQGVMGTTGLCEEPSAPSQGGDTGSNPVGGATRKSWSRACRQRGWSPRASHSGSSANPVPIPFARVGDGHEGLHASPRPELGAAGLPG